jgi:hypothetical protein
MAHRRDSDVCDLAWGGRWSWVPAVHAAPRRERAHRHPAPDCGGTFIRAAAGRRDRATRLRPSAVLHGGAGSRARYPAARRDSRDQTPLGLSRALETTLAAGHPRRALRILRDPVRPYCAHGTAAHRLAQRSKTPRPRCSSTPYSPAPPDGIEFGLPNELFLDKHGKTYDGAGIPPDIRVPVFTSRQLTLGLDAALDTDRGLFGRRPMILYPPAPFAA